MQNKIVNDIFIRYSFYINQIAHSQCDDNSDVSKIKRNTLDNITSG